MTSEHSLRAPAKINWTMEVLGRRDDGYHEVRTVLQTIALSDTITVKAADGLQLELSGDPGQLSSEAPEANLAFRGADLLREASGVDAGAHIGIHKRIPVAAGLGGGSSDAAATLRALASLWQVSIPRKDLASIAAQLGSDVPFFLSGGTALGRGRGDQLTLLPDIQHQRLILAWPDRASENKTTQMYSALQEANFSDGATTERLAKSTDRPTAISDEAITNVFEAVLRGVDPEAGQTFTDAHAAGQAHLAGSGPAFFFLLGPTAPAKPLIRSLARMGLSAIETHTISGAEALGQP